MTTGFESLKSTYETPEASIVAQTSRETKKLSREMVSNFLDKLANLVGVGKKETKTSTPTVEPSVGDVVENTTIVVPMEIKSESREQHVELANADQLKQIILYMSHQQGDTGVKVIVDAASNNITLDEAIQRAPGLSEKNRQSLKQKMPKHLSANINTKEFNALFGTNYKNNDDAKGRITPRQFLKYRSKKFTEKWQQYSKKTDYDAIIIPLAEKYDVKPEMVRTVIGTESAFNPKSGNSKYIGLMAIGEDEAVALGFNPDDRRDPAKNIEMGIKLMKQKSAAITSTVDQFKNSYASIMNPSQDVYRNVA